MIFTINGFDKYGNVLGWLFPSLFFKEKGVRNRRDELAVGHFAGEVEQIKSPKAQVPGAFNKCKSYYLVTTSCLTVLVSPWFNSTR
jgi:hypothetical protein